MDEQVRQLGFAYVGQIIANDEGTLSLFAGLELAWKGSSNISVLRRTDDSRLARLFVVKRRKVCSVFCHPPMQFFGDKPGEIIHGRFVTWNGCT